MSLFEKPKAVVLCGLPLSGKTSYARAFTECDETPYRSINKNVILNALFHTTSSNYNKFPVYVFKQAHSLVKKQIQENAVYNNNIIVDDHHLNEEERKEILSLLQSLNYDVEVHLIDTPYLVCRKRMHNRMLPFKQFTTSIFKEYLFCMFGSKLLKEAEMLSIPVISVRNFEK